MANLILPHRFVPGQLALASEMNANFEAIETWAGGNLGTTNITVLEARPGGGSILEFNQTANFPVIELSNSGADSAIDITQAGLLQTGKAVIQVTDSNNQPAVGATNTAHFRLTLNGLTNIPAIEVKHGPTQNTLTVTRTGITTDVGITTAGTLTATSINLTQPLTLIAQTADALALKIKGRASDNTSKIELKSNNDATTYASITSSTGGISLNLPDTADSYTFTIGNPPVTKAVIDNSGIDGQYLFNIPGNNVANNSITEQKLAPNLITVTPVPSPTYFYVDPIYRTFHTLTTFTITQPRAVMFVTDSTNLLLNVVPDAIGSFDQPITFYFLIMHTSGWARHLAYATYSMIRFGDQVALGGGAIGTGPWLGPGQLGEQYFERIVRLPYAGTYTITLGATGPDSNNWRIQNFLPNAYLL